VDHVPTPYPLLRLAQLSFAGTAYVFIVGMLRGGDFSKSLWQIDKVIYLPLVFLVSQAALRGPKDYLAMGRVLLFAGIVRAALAIYIFKTVVMPPDYYGNPQDLPGRPPTMIRILFADGVVLILALLVHRLPWGKLTLFLVMPLLCGGWW